MKASLGGRKTSSGIWLETRKPTGSGTRLITAGEIVANMSRNRLCKIMRHTDVSEVANRVHETVDEDEPSDDLVKVDVSVEGQQPVEAELAELRDGVAEHEDEDEHAVEVEALA